MFVRKSKYDKLKYQLKLLESNHDILNQEYGDVIKERKELLSKISDLENQIESKDMVIELLNLTSKDRDKTISELKSKIKELKFYNNKIRKHKKKGH